MNSTTLSAFWQGFTSTTVETLFGNYEFFGMVLIIAIVIMVIGGIYISITNSAKHL